MGNRLLLQGTIRDITNEKQINDALKNSEEKYRTLFENVEVGMFCSTIDSYKMLAVNNKICEITELSKQELLAKPAFIHWKNIDDRIKMIQELKNRGSINEYIQ